MIVPDKKISMNITRFRIFYIFKAMIFFSLFLFCFILFTLNAFKELLRYLKDVFVYTCVYIYLFVVMKLNFRDLRERL